MSDRSPHFPRETSRTPIAPTHPRKWPRHGKGWFLPEEKRIQTPDRHTTRSSARYTHTSETQTDDKQTDTRGLLGWGNYGGVKETERHLVPPGVPLIQHQQQNVKAKTGFTCQLAGGVCFSFYFYAAQVFSNGARVASVGKCSWICD